MKTAEKNIGVVTESFNVAEKAAMNKFCSMIENFQELEKARRNKLKDKISATTVGVVI